MSHLKSFFVPKSWTLKKKGKVFVVRPRPGAVSAELSVPVAHMIRSLGFASTVREIRQIMKSKGVLHNGKPIDDYKLPVGFMDLVEFRPLNKVLRLLIDAKGRIVYVDAKDAKRSVAKVAGKTVVKGGKTQLNLSGGRNVLSDIACKVGDSVMLSIPDAKIEKVFRLEKGANIFLVKGSHTGKTGVVENIADDRLWFRRGDEVFETLKGYALVIGDLKL